MLQGNECQDVEFLEFHPDFQFVYNIPPEMRQFYPDGVSREEIEDTFLFCRAADAFGKLLKPSDIGNEIKSV